jgi:hypothetical protein
MVIYFQILYTGDFSRQEDRHLMAAEIPNVKPDVLITVSVFVCPGGVNSNSSTVETKESNINCQQHNVSSGAENLRVINDQFENIDVKNLVSCCSLDPVRNSPFAVLT